MITHQSFDASSSGLKENETGVDIPGGGNLAISSIGILADWSGDMCGYLLLMTVGLRTI